MIFDRPRPNDHEVELDRIEAAWADFVYAARTGDMHIRDGTADQKVDLRGLVGLHQQFEVFRARHEAGEAGALFEALGLACAVPVPMPYWLANELRARFTRVWNEPITLHDAMGLQVLLPAGGKKATSARKELLARKRLWRLVTELMRPARLPDGTAAPPACASLDAAIKRLQAEKKLHVGATKAKALFEEQERIQQMHATSTTRRKADKRRK